ncbi:SymE family type I addiction module toxin [Serratia sp. DD3]|uniref:SymE family type I addiction module toxin n=1 Tax=Serratia sp. DD3 TaxID=1410619 RepID=UPI0003C51CB2|nr:SymE family type I addiction module toxin [Serratia sp. DD3]KEY58179.1 hypothetical protein SRDD_29380 [Serratia sp. DD3]
MLTIPELIINSEDVTSAGFIPGAVFKIEQYQDGLVITLVSDEVEIERLLLEVDVPPDLGVDWVRDNGELYLAGEWLTQTSLAGQPLAISMMTGKVVIRVQQSNMLA